jgi:hypothetical protein
MVAAGANHKDAVLMLIKLGARIDMTDNDQRTALHHAVEANALEAAEALVARGANKESQDWEGRTPHDLAKAKGDAWAPIRRMLTERAADVTGSGGGDDGTSHLAEGGVPREEEEDGDEDDRVITAVRGPVHHGRRHGSQPRGALGCGGGGGGVHEEEEEEEEMMMPPGTAEEEDKMPLSADREPEEKKGRDDEGLPLAGPARGLGGAGQQSQKPEGGDGVMPMDVDDAPPSDRREHPSVSPMASHMTLHRRCGWEVVSLG